MRKEGKLIDFAGPEGAGKSTQIVKLADRLIASGVNIVMSKEPYGEFRKKLCFGKNLSCEEELELLLKCRKEHFQELVLPSLKKGKWVLVDGCSAKTIAYQGFGRGFNLGEIKRRDEKVRQGRGFDLIILLDMDSGEARDRKSGEVPDRIEREPIEFHERVKHGYLEQAKQDPRTWLVVECIKDGRELTREEIAEIIWQEVQKRFF